MQEKFNAGQVMWSRGDKEGDLDLFNYEHFWKEVPEADVVKIMEPVKEENRITAELLAKVEQQLDSHLQQSTDGGAGMLSTTQDSWRSEEGSSSSTQEDKIVSDLHKHLDRMEERLKEHVDKRVLSIRMDIQQLQERVTSSLLCIMTKLDTMVGYSRALEDARVPRLPFISFTDVQFHQRIKNVLQIGTPVRLHLMCESRFRPHSVLGQPGLSLTIGEENKEWLRCISVNALKIVWTVLKLGVDSQLPGAGALIPELGDLSSGLVQVDRMTLDELKDAKLDSLPRVEGSETVKNMWRFLERTLPREKIPKDFRLQLVRYNPGIVAADQAYAWLCQTCIDQGEKNNVLRSN
ncbi:hypothetical protein R1sor_021730 [Riccia sorocarpa]|uniref:Uncharacterized protein n=1 Tax=Riccia sorocarpa TaxID=122646 RepID=A0ABD3GM42_9MARC